MNRLLYYLIIYFILSAQCVAAQPYFDLVGISYFQSFAGKKLTRTTLSAFNSFVNIPIRHDSDFTIISSEYAHLAISIRHQPDINLNGYRLSVTRLHSWKAGWKSAFVFNARSNTGYSSAFNTENFQFGGAFVSTKKVSDSFKYSFGLYYNSEYFGPFFVPLIGANWLVSKNFRIFGLLPNNLYLDYKLSRYCRAGFTFSFITSSYRIEYDQYFRYNENQVRAYVNWILGSSHVLSLEAGHSAGRKYSKGQIDTEIQEDHNLLASQGWIFKLSYTFRIFE